MKTNLLKIILSLLLIFAMVLTLFSCTSEVEKITESVTDSSELNNTTNMANYDKVKDYQIIQIEDEYRLAFDDPSIYSEYDRPGVVGFEIDSWENFSDRLLSGTLTLDEKISIYYRSKKDEQGVVILNPYVSYKISHSLPHQIDNGGWYNGASYTTDITCFEGYTFPVQITILSKSSYNSQYGAAFIDAKEKNVEYEKKLSDNTVMTCYNKVIKKYGYSTDEKYILSDGEKNIFVVKVYSDDYYDGVLPYNFECLVNIKNEIYFSINFSWDDITEDITDEFIFGFDVEAIERT